jgi:phage shock protein A
MNIFRRIFKIGEAEANAAVDKMEDPIKMTEQGIRDMRQDLDKSVEALAQVKAMAIRSKNDRDNYREQAEDYQNKAILILKKAHKGDMDATEADNLAKEALKKKEETQKKVDFAQQESDKFDASVAQLQNTIQELKSTITNWENELRTLKSRVKVSKATKNVNKQMAELDSSGTVSMLERMKEKVAQEEALAQAYGDMAKKEKDIDQKLAEAADTTQAEVEDDLAALKKKLGMDQDTDKA